MQAIRIIEIPDCKMVSSGIGMFGEENFTAFNAWFAAFPRTKDPRDFAAEAPGGVEWLYIYEDGMTVPERFGIVDFKGGLYAVNTDIDQQTDIESMDKELRAFLQKHGFERDKNRRRMGNIITPPEAAEVMGFSQMDYYMPIKISCAE
ncbi:MAG: AraC family transcriptional regulator [Oscillospiraceae bacterium]|nr:AraC family transcriptional regulator [Oscillospiraceae bacterium]